MDFLLDCSSGAIWGNLSKDQSILTNKLRGPAPAWPSMDVAGGWRTCFPACHNRLIVLQTPSVAPPELNRRATHAGTAPGRRQFRFAGAPRLQARRAAPLVSNTVSVRTGNALTSPESVVLGTKRIYCWKTIGNHDFEWYFPTESGRSYLRLIS